MKKGKRTFSGLAGLGVLAGLLGSASLSFAQTEGFTLHQGFTPFGMVVMVVFLVLGFGFYIYTSLALQVIARKTNTANGWIAWIPIINIFLMLNIAKKPVWWFILLLIPLVNIVILIIVWMAIAEACKKPNWWGILTIVPVVNLIVPGYLAWAA